MTNFISFELAKLFKELNIDVYKTFRHGSWAYDANGKLYRYKGRGLYPTTEIVSIIMWLYERHNIFIYCRPTSFGDIAVFIENPFGKPLYDKEDSKLYEQCFTCMYEIKDGYEAAIEYALKNLIICKA